LDDKILTSWNALMIKGMAIAGQILQREDFIDSAYRALVFLREQVYSDGRLLATWKEGRARFPAYLDDYAFLLDAGLALLQSRWDKSTLTWIISLADTLLVGFEDTQNGGFFFTAHDHETLIHRPKTIMDEAMPAGNGVAAFALHRLGHLLGDLRYTAAAERVLQAAMPTLQDYPHACGSLLNVLDEWETPAQMMVLRGDAAAMQAWQISATYAPNRLCIAIPAAENDLPGLLAERKPGAGVVAYLCQATTCLPPIESLDEFQQRLLDR
jgi:hypothetical protein